MPLSKEITTEAASINRHPLNDFWGDLVDISDFQRPNRTNPNRMNTFIRFDLADLEILEAREPFTFPVTFVEIMELNIPGTPWEVLKESIKKSGFEGNLSDLVTKRLHFKWADAILNQLVNGTYVNQPSHCWQVVEIKGVENTQAQLMDKIIELADTRNAAEFKTVFMAERSIMQLTGYSDAMMAVVNNQLLGTLVAAQKLTVDGSGNYHKVA